MNDMEVAYWMAKYDTLKGEYGELREDYTIAEDRIAELENPWVSVEDRMPDEGVNVLTYGARPDYDVIYINRRIDEKQCEWLYDGVTHWMPLPDYPNHQMRMMQNEVLLNTIKRL